VREPRTSDHGFTLIEVLVATLILSSGAIAAAGLFVTAAASTRTAKVETQSTLFAAAKMEQLHALAWGYDISGGPVTDTSTDLSVEPPSSGGTGLRASPIDSLDRNCSGFVDYLDAGGRWVGTGSAPPAQAVYLRRWSIQPLAQFPNDGLVLEVLVTSVARDRSRITAANARRGLEGALVAVRMRHAR